MRHSHIVKLYCTVRWDDGVREELGNWTPIRSHVSCWKTPYSSGRCRGFSRTLPETLIRCSDKSNYGPARQVGQYVNGCNKVGLFPDICAWPTVGLCIYSLSLSLSVIFCIVGLQYTLHWSRRNQKKVQNFLTVVFGCRKPFTTLVSSWQVVGKHGWDFGIGAFGVRVNVSSSLLL